MLHRPDRPQCRVPAHRAQRLAFPCEFASDRDDDIGSGFDEQAGRGTADIASATNDDCSLVVKLHVRNLALLRAVMRITC